MIAFCWQDNWIILDVFHGMTDGTGAYEVVRTLLYYYCSERYNVKLNDEGIRLIGDEIKAEEWIDPVANEENGIVYDLQDVNELELANIKLPWT